MKKGRIVKLEIDRTSFGGRGIAKIDGYTVFVDGAVPGDIVEARIIRRKKQYAEAVTHTVLRPSDDRIDPPCPYAGYCGGCKWQFLSYEAQLKYKRLHVIETLERIGGITKPVVHEVIPASSVFAYRNKMEFSCAARRWLLPSELGVPGISKEFAVGLHVPGTFDKVLDIEACLLQPEPGNRILQSTRKWMKNSGFPAYNLRTHEGFWRFVVLRNSRLTGELMVNIVTKTEESSHLREMAEYLLSVHPCIGSIVNSITAGKAAVAVGDYENILHGPGVIKERLGSFIFEVSPNSFFQTNTCAAEILYETVKRYASLSGKEVVFDLYCGTGTISIWLARNAEKIFGVEISKSAVADAEKNCTVNGIYNCCFEAADIRTWIQSRNIVPDLLVIDPPRSGMHPDVVKAVADLSASRIVYVSCNPSTMARDIAGLIDNYHLCEVQPVDQFPHTYHIEAVALLEKRRA